MNREYDNKTLKRLQQVELEILKDFMKICDENNIKYFGFAGTGIGAIRHKGFIPWDDDIDIALTRDDYERALELVKDVYKDKYTVVNPEEFDKYPLMTTRIMKKGTKFVEFPLKDIDCELGIFLDVYAFDNISDDPKEFKKQGRDAWFWSKLMILRSLPFPVLPVKGWKARIIHCITAMVHYLMVIFRVSRKFLYRKCKEACTRYNDRETRKIAYLCSTNPYTIYIDIDKLYPLVKYDFEDTELYFPKDIDSILRQQFGDYMQLPPVEKRKNHYPHELDFGSEE